MAVALLEALRTRGTPTFWIDSDSLRRVLRMEQKYTPEARDQFYEIVGHLATEAARGGVTVVVSATAPRRHHRDRVRAAVDDFVEVLLVCGRKRLLERDPKGLYLKAHHGEIQNFPGVSAAFESPAKAELVLDTGRIEPVQAVDAILRTLDARATKRPMTEVPPTVTKPYHDSA